MKNSKYYIGNVHNATVFRIGKAERNAEMRSVICLEDMCIGKLRNEVVNMFKIIKSTSAL